MRGLVLSLLLLAATGSFCILMYQVVSRDYRYLQLVKLGDELLEEGLPFQAAQTYGAAIGLRPDKYLSYLKRAEAFERQGDLASAMTDLLKAEKLSADSYTVSLRLAGLSYAREDFAEAARYYTRVVELDPEAPISHYRLALACFRAGREEEALDALGRAISLQADFWQAYYLRAAVYRSLGRWGEAEADYRTCLSLQPEASEPREALLALYLAEATPSASRKALELVREQINRQPHEPSHYLRLADVYRVQGRNGDAIEAVGLALEQDPNLPEAYLRLGELWLEEGLGRGDRVAFEKAVTALDSVSQMDPANGRAALALGRAHLATGDTDAAFTDLQRAAEATPIQAEAYRLLGELYQSRGNYAEAVTAYHVYLKLKGDAPEVQERLGDVYLAMENPSAAGEAYLHLASMDPNRVSALVKAARAFLLARAPRDAESAVRRGLALSPENVALQSLLAQASRQAANVSRGRRP